MQIDETSHDLKNLLEYTWTKRVSVDGDDESNTFQTGTEKGQYMRKHKIVPVLLNGLSCGLQSLKLTGENPNQSR